MPSKHSKSSKPSKRKLTQLTTQECRAQLVTYKKKRLIKKDIRGVRSLDPVIRGIPAAKKGFIHRVNQCGQYENEATKIPWRFKQVKTTEKDKKWHCDTPFNQTAADQAEAKAIEVSKWIKDASRKAHLTIAQVLKMKKGQKTKFLMLDRNVYDNLDGQATNKAMVASKFFQGCWAIYTHDHGMEGTMKFAWQSKDEAGLPFMFEINYRDESWYPLDVDGALPAKDPQGVGKLLGKRMPYTKFPKSTRVGYRGPMVPWSKLKALPKVYKCQWCGFFTV